VKMRATIPMHYKHAILRRQKRLCNVCSDVLDVYDIDHIVPYRICQEHKLSNLQALCPTCHARKTRSEAKYVAEYKQNLIVFAGAVKTSYQRTSGLKMDVVRRVRFR
jgi:5-methylcytosine-specific restriction endonuclease McrA